MRTPPPTEHTVRSPVLNDGLGSCRSDLRQLVELIEIGCVDVDLQRTLALVLQRSALDDLLRECVRISARLVYLRPGSRGAAHRIHVVMLRSSGIRGRISGGNHQPASRAPKASSGTPFRSSRAMRVSSSTSAKSQGSARRSTCSRLMGTSSRPWIVTSSAAKALTQVLQYSATASSRIPEVWPSRGVSFRQAEDESVHSPIDARVSWSSSASRRNAFEVQSV